MDVATLLEGRQEVWRRDQGFEVATRAFYREDRGWSRQGRSIGETEAGRDLV